MTGIEAFFQLMIARLRVSLTLAITIDYPSDFPMFKEIES